MQVTKKLSVLKCALDNLSAYKFYKNKLKLKHLGNKFNSLCRWRGIMHKTRKKRLAALTHLQILKSFKAGPDPTQASDLCYNVLSSIAKNIWKETGKPVTDSKTMVRSTKITRETFNGICIF